MSYYVSAQPNITAEAALRHLASTTNDASARWMMEQLAEACEALASLNSSLRQDIDRWEDFAESRVDGPVKSPDKAAEKFDRIVRANAAFATTQAELERTVNKLRAQIVELTSPDTDPEKPE